MALPFARYTGQTLNQALNVPALGAKVDVYLANTLVHAVIFSDAAGEFEIGNPLTSDLTTGVFSFCAANGLYDITITPVAGTGTPYTIAAAQLLYGVGPVGQFLVATTTFPHAQILTWPSQTNGLTLVPAPGAGLTVVPLLVRAVMDTRGGAYTNIDTGATPNTGAYLDVHTLDWTHSLFSALVNGYGAGTDNTDALGVTDFLGVVGQQLWSVLPFAAGTDPFNGASQAFFAGGWGVVGNPTVIPWTAAQNQPLIAFLTNGALGNLTGGAPANSVTFTVAYLLLP